MTYDIIVVGGGPAGLTAALYGARAGKSVLVIEKNTLGGQISWSPAVENFPALGKISGNELADKLVEQVMAQGADIELDEVLSAERADTGFSLKTRFSERGFEARSLILALGAKPRRLGLQEEGDYVGNGESFCAVCDGAFYKGTTVAVVGGGNAALQDAVLLSQLCRHVYIIHRRDSFRGEECLADVLRGNENVEFLMKSTIVSLHGEGTLRSVTVATPAGEREILLDGLFVAVGHDPDCGIFSHLLTLDESGYADAGEDCTGAVPGVFVAGDCRSKAIRQLTTAMADGTCAALGACDYLSANR